ncbi:MAG: DUF4340 domain-containing protein [Deltaproteobacteria bacterium]|nr:DUF4340 domain-containing protein [Deltaproteobacteria bacterium]
MTAPRKLIVLAISLTLIVIGTWLDYRKRTTDTPFVKLGEVSKVELLIRTKKVALTKAGTHWQLESFDEKPTVDRRVNENLINHLLDIIKVVNDQTQSPLNPNDAQEYGMKEPLLAVTLGWEKPTVGSEVVIFGNRNLSGKQIFAYFPKRPLLAELPVVSVALLENKQALDVRDRRITTFEPDDVEDLQASGRCGSFKLSRDGDRWTTSSGSALEANAAESWLATLLGTQYDGIEDKPSATPSEDLNPVCNIALAGRHARKESIEIFKTRGTLWAKNSILPALYHLPQGIMSALITPYSKPAHE